MEKIKMFFKILFCKHVYNHKRSTIKIGFDYCWVDYQECSSCGHIVIGGNNE